MCEHFPAALALNFRYITAEKFWPHGRSSNQMFDLAAQSVENDRLTRVVARLAANLREEGGEAVIIIHRPTVEWVVVALSTLDAHAHEDLGGSSLYEFYILAEFA